MKTYEDAGLLDIDLEVIDFLLLFETNSALNAD